MVPLEVMAQVWAFPNATKTKPLPTSAGVDLSVVLLMPNYPRLFLPQHLRDDGTTIAQACTPPAATNRTLLPREVTSVGVFLSVVVPMPSWP